MPRNVISELKIPAESEYIGVAKRVASTLGSKLGFSLEEIDELNIAVAQACDSAIEAAEDAWGGGASLKLTFGTTVRGIEVEVQAMRPPAPPAHRPEQRDQELQRLAHEMIRCFVDDFNTRIDGPRGQVRFRMVKYLLG